MKYDTVTLDEMFEIMKGEVMKNKNDTEEIGTITMKFNAFESAYGYNHISQLEKKVELLEKKLEIAVKFLKKYEIDETFEGGVGKEIEDMMFACTDTLKQIERVK